mgnify:CR=1 FL=1|jgi:hypothetical protein
MSLPSPPQNEPQRLKDARKSVMRDSLITIIKKKRAEPSEPPKKSPPKKSLLNSKVTDPDTAYQIWQYPR